MNHRKSTSSTSPGSDGRSRAAALRKRFTELRGYWDPVWEPVVTEAPEVFEAYLELSGRPWRSARLAPLTKELLYVAMDASSTHLYRVGTRIHLGNALRLGATKQQVLGVLALLVELGTQTLTSGLPILARQAVAHGLATGDVGRPTEAPRVAGLWTEEVSEILGLDPELQAVWTRYGEVARAGAGLDPTLAALVPVAYTASATNLHLPSLDAHVGAALAAGVRPAEIVEVFEIVSVVGVHALAEALPIALELFDQADADREGDPA